MAVCLLNKIIHFIYQNNQKMLQTSINLHVMQN